MSELNASINQAPESSSAERYLAFALFVLSFLYLCLFRRHTTLDLDEGIILQGAQRILDGQVLYRDFFAFVTPGSYYLLALVFRVFGNSYVVAHTALAVEGATFSPITYLLARRACSRQGSLLVTGLMVATALPLVFAVLHNWDSTLWACLALYSAVRLVESPSSGWAFAAASFTSVTILFEQSKGAGLALGLGLGFLLITLGNRESNLFTRERLGAAAAGLAWPFLTTAAYFASQHTLLVMLYDWLWPLWHYSAANRVPWGYGNMSEQAQHIVFGSGSFGFRIFVMLVYSTTFWVPFLPLWAAALLLRLAFLKWRCKPIPTQWNYYVLVSATVIGLLLSVMAGRLDYFHFMFLQPIFFLVLAWLIDGRGIRTPFFVKIAPIVGLLLSLSLLTEAAQVLFQASTGKTVTTRRGTITMERNDEVIGPIQDYVAPREKILIYPYFTTYYYLTETYSPTRYEYYQPGMHTYEQLQEMVTDFSAHPTRAVLYEPAFADHIHEAWPNTPASALARDPMADYILHQYRNCGVLTSSSGWHFEFMVRHDLACPSSNESSSR